MIFFILASVLTHLFLLSTALSLNYFPSAPSCFSPLSSSLPACPWILAALIYNGWDRVMLLDLDTLKHTNNRAHTHIGQFGLQGKRLCLCNLLVICLIRLHQPSSCLSAAFVCCFVTITYWCWQWREIVTSICLVNMFDEQWHVCSAFGCLNFRLIRHTALNLVFLLFLLLPNISWLYAYTHSCELKRCDTLVVFQARFLVPVQESSQSRRVVVSHNVDKAMKEGNWFFKVLWPTYALINAKH